MPTVAVERRLDTFKDEYVMNDKNENYIYIYIYILRAIINTTSIIRKMNINNMII